MNYYDLHSTFLDAWGTELSIEKKTRTPKEKGTEPITNLYA